jgi:hypothetical protein
MFINLKKDKINNTEKLKKNIAFCLNRRLNISDE